MLPTIPSSTYLVFSSSVVCSCFALLTEKGATQVFANRLEAQASKDLQAGPILATLFWAASWNIRRQARTYSVAYRYLFMHPSGTNLSALATLIDRQKLETVINRLIPFVRITDAFAYLEQGHAKGKMGVQMV